MPWNTFIFPIIAGYILVKYCNIFKYRIQRLPKDRVVLESLIIGFVLLTTTFLIKAIIYFKVKNTVYILRKKLNNEYSYLFDCIKSIQKFLSIDNPTILVNFLITVTCTVLFIFVTNIIFSDYNCKKKVIKKFNNKFEIKMLESVEENKLLAFTLDNSKVYIGIVKDIPTPEVTKHVPLLVVFSGYRDENKKICIDKININIINNTYRKTSLYLAVCGIKWEMPIFKRLFLCRTHKRVSRTIRHISNNNIEAILEYSKIASVVHFNPDEYFK